ncbi:MAG TPA: 3-isopropylmalate dehydratase small subunit [Candidatus Atribacteria bacterium]|jgi:3-isopropylmalate/(R)-2-methylmalate dehydratase small subunit|nr:MAG: 3-isopropylmalate dehydratase small subunit [Atribacteria bacterium 34_128]HAJ33071.1 3-isopropylmalate dehydratase small subunit [Candidatus Atribacteria bacterium]
MIIKGKVWKFKDNIDTDVIIPARYLNTSLPKELALHCMEDYDAEFVKKIDQGDIIVAGRNFGCGSSREHAPIALKAAGVSCIIAPSFARIFFRNAINIGLPIFESEEIADQCSEGDLLKVDTAKGIIENINKGKTYQLNPLPAFIQNIISLGGLREYVEEEVKRRKGDV